MKLDWRRRGVGIGQGMAAVFLIAILCSGCGDVAGPADRNSTAAKGTAESDRPEARPAAGEETDGEDGGQSDEEDGADTQTDARIEAILLEAADRRREILNSATDVVYSGTAYYVSESGDDANSGKAENEPWASMKKVNETIFQPGDAVFFQRGGLWRGTALTAQEGVVYSAYGEGEKPKIYLSPENGAGGEKWSLLEGTDDIWVYEKELEDCGNIVFDNGEQCGKKELPFYDGNGFRRQFDHAAEYDVRKELTEDLEFFTPGDSALPDTLPFYPQSYESAGKVYLCSKEGNPGERFAAIEFLVSGDIVDFMYARGCVIDNLCLMYAGGCATTGGNSDVTVQNCEVGWIGGCVFTYDGEDTYEGGVIGAGDGIKINGLNHACLNNYVHDVYDYGVTAETGFDGEFDPQDNLRFSGNVLEHCGGGILIFNWENPANPEHLFKNIVIEDNISLFHGYGEWKRFEDYQTSALNFFEVPNANEGMVISGNVFGYSTGPLVYGKIPKIYCPDFQDNTYIQAAGMPMISWETTGEESVMAQYPEVEAVILRDMGETNPTILISEGVHENTALPNTPADSGRLPK